MADIDDIGGGFGPSHAPDPDPARDGDLHPLRAASGALFVALLPWAVAGYFLFSWAGGSIAALVNEYRLPLTIAAVALSAFSLWQLAQAARHLFVWLSRRRRS